MDEESARWKDRFGSERHSQTYDNLINIFSLRRAERMEVLKAILPPAIRPRYRILEIGAGTGVVTELLMKYYTDTLMTAVDGAASMLERAKAKRYFLENENRIKWVTADYSDSSWLEGIENPFELIVIFDALHHLSHERKKQLYAEVYDLVKADGYLYISDHIVTKWEYYKEPQYSLWMEEILKNLHSLEKGCSTANIIERAFSWSYEDIQNLSVLELKKIFTERLMGEGENPMPLMHQVDILNEIGFKRVTVEYRFSNFAIISARK